MRDERARRYQQLCHQHPDNYVPWLFLFADNSIFAANDPLAAPILTGSDGAINLYGERLGQLVF